MDYILLGIIILLAIIAIFFNSEMLKAQNQIKAEHESNVAVLCKPLPSDPTMTNTFNYECPGGNISRFEQIGISIPINNSNDTYRIGGN